MTSPTATTWLSLAFSRRTVLRAIKVSAVVGTLLVVINHLPAIMNAGCDRFRALQIVLTYFVPYSVATWSSVSALLDAEKSESPSK